MPKYLRPLFVAGHTYMAAKVVTINGVAYVPGDRLTAEAIIEVGDAKMRKIYDAKLIDYTTDDVPAHYQKPGAEPEPVAVTIAPKFSERQQAPASDDEKAAAAAEEAALIAANAGDDGQTGAPAGEVVETASEAAPAASEAAPPAPPAISGTHTAKHMGFGKWWIIDAEGNKISGPHKQPAALALIDTAAVNGV